MSNHRTDAQLASIVTRSTRDHQLKIAKKWGIPPGVVAHATLGLGVAMLLESGFTEDEIVETARQLVADRAFFPPRTNTP